MLARTLLAFSILYSLLSSGQKKFMPIGKMDLSTSIHVIKKTPYKYDQKLI